jgi:hypothetical protein
LASVSYGPEASITRYFVLAAVLALVAVVLLHGTASAVVESLACPIALGACIRAASLAVRDDDISSRTIRSPVGRTLGIMGADSRSAPEPRQSPRNDEAPDGVGRLEWAILGSNQ